MILYKYRGCSKHTWELLLNRKLFFALPSQLNDPLDSRVDLSAEYKRTWDSIVNSGQNDRKLSLLSFLNEYHHFVDTTSGQRHSLNEIISLFTADQGILAFSRTATDMLLWAHYADGHRGLCLGFDAGELYWEDVFIKMEVVYWDTPPYMEVFIHLIEELEKILPPSDKIELSNDQMKEFSENHAVKLMKSVLCSKSSNWEYEQEYRMVSARNGKHEFPPSALKEVIRGVNLAESDAETLRNILCHQDYAHVQVRDVRHVPGSYKFNFAISPEAGNARD